MKKVKCIKEFFEAQFQTKWVGVAQQLHLIHEYPSEFNWIIDEDNNKKSVLLREKNQDNTYGFCGVILAKLQKGIYNTKDLRENLYHQLSLEKNQIKDLEWNAFYSLGAEDVVFIVLANSIRKIHHFVSMLTIAKKTGKGFVFCGKFICKYE